MGYDFGILTSLMKEGCCIEIRRLACHGGNSALPGCQAASHPADNPKDLGIIEL